MSDRITAVRNELSVAKRAIDKARILADGIEAQVAEETAGMVEHVNGQIFLCGRPINPLRVVKQFDAVYMPDVTYMGDGGSSKRFRYVEQYHRFLFDNNLLFATHEDADNAADALVSVMARVGKIG